MTPRRGGSSDHCPTSRQTTPSKTSLLYPEEQEEEELMEQVLQILEKSSREMIATASFPTPPSTPNVTDDEFGEEVDTVEVSSQKRRPPGPPRKYNPWWCFKCHGFGHKFRHCPVTYWRIPFCKTCGLWSYEILEEPCPNVDDPRHRLKRSHRR